MAPTRRRWPWCGTPSATAVSNCCARLGVFVPLLLVGWRAAPGGRSLPGVALLLVAVMVLAQSWNLRPLYCTTVGLLLVLAVGFTTTAPGAGRCRGGCRSSCSSGPICTPASSSASAARRGDRLGVAQPRPAAQRPARPAFIVAADLDRRARPRGHVPQPRPDRTAPLSVPSGKATSAHARLHRDAAAVILPHATALHRRPRLRRRLADRLDAVTAFPPIPALGNRSYGRPWRPRQRRFPGSTGLAARDARPGRSASGTHDARFGAGPAAAFGSFVEGLLHAPAFRFQWYWPAAFTALVVVSVTAESAVPVQNHPDWPVAAVD